MDQSTIDCGSAGDNAVRRTLSALHAKVYLTVLGKEAEFLETSRIYQSAYTLAGGQFALLMLRFESFRAAALLKLFFPFAKRLDETFHCGRTFDVHLSFPLVMQARQ
jgi:hypothetical protein